MPINLQRILGKSWTHSQGLEGDLKAVVLAAGLGSRMKPLTNCHLPKPMFPIGGAAPILEAWVRKFVASGITDVSMNLSVLSHTIRDHFQDGARFGARVTYVEESKPSGTLGGVCKQVLGREAKVVTNGEAPPSVEPFSGSTVFVMSGDIVTNFSPALMQQMYEIHKAKGAAFTMILSPVPWEMRGQFGTVELDEPEQLGGPISRSGQVKNFLEKDPKSPSNLNNCSIYMLEADFIRALDPLRTEASVDLEEPFYDFGKQVIPAMLGRVPYVSLPPDAMVWGLEYDGLWFDVGRKRDYLGVNAALLDGELEMELPYQRLPWGYLGHNVDLPLDEVTIEPPVIIGNDCVIRPGARLGPNAVIGDGWYVGQDARVVNSVLWPRGDYLAEDGRLIPASERAVIDPHEIRAGASVEGCIVVGGGVEGELRDSTVDVLEDGSTEVRSIDWLPEGKRA